MKVILTVLFATFAVFASGANDFQLKANDYFHELTAEIGYEVGVQGNITFHLSNNYSIEIGGSPFTLSLNNGTIENLNHITHSGAGNVVYTIPAVGALFTVGDAVLEFKFRLESNLNSVNSSEGKVTLELSGVSISVAIAVHESSANNYTANIVKDKLAVVGNLESVSLSSGSYVNTKDFVELWYQKHASSISTAIHREFSRFFHDAVKKVDISRYVEK